MGSLVAVLSFLVITFGLTYAFTLLGMGAVLDRRNRRRMTQVAVAGSDASTVFVMIPCLNESAVIGSTVTHLLEGAATARADVRIIVIDDGSDDDTEGAARLAAARMGESDRLSVSSRRKPDARRGKGAALNAAYLDVQSIVAFEGLDPAQVVVCVMDADGQMTPGAIDAAVSAFADPWIGGVQLPVRIRNRTSMVARLQDWEFWVFSALTQIARSRLGNTSLGGNGQFTRLAALETLEGLPWSSSLTEDLDLTLRLLLKGWRTTCVAEHHVHQQGLTSLRALVRQRTRWFQGHLVSLRYVPRIWMSPKLKSLTSIETVLYLLVPVALVLPWSILGHINAVLFVQRYHLRSVLPIGGSLVVGRALDAFLLYVLSFLPNLLAGYLYLRRDRSVGRLRAFAIGHVLVVYNYVAYLACWRALFRVLRGKTTWDKTQRVDETPTVGLPVPALP